MFNTEKRKLADTLLEKEFYKFLNNCMFAKTIEFVRRDTNLFGKYRKKML